MLCPCIINCGDPELIFMLELGKRNQSTKRYFKSKNRVPYSWNISQPLKLYDKSIKRNCDLTINCVLRAHVYKG